MHPMALLALVLACLAFAADRVWQRYMEYRLAQETPALAEGFEQSLQQLAEQERARVQQLHRSGAASGTGFCQGSNSTDWRRAYQTNPQLTACSEVQRHCQIYKRFLAAGIAPGRMG